MTKKISITYMSKDDAIKMMYGDRSKTIKDMEMLDCVKALKKMRYRSSGWRVVNPLSLQERLCWEVRRMFFSPTMFFIRISYWLRRLKKYFTNPLMIKYWESKMKKQIYGAFGDNKNE